MLVHFLLSITVYLWNTGVIFYFIVSKRSYCEMTQLKWNQQLKHCFVFLEAHLPSFRTQNQ